MITGSVDDKLQPVVRLTVCNEAGDAIEIEAIIDTGFNGTLTLPLTAIQKLKLPLSSKGAALLADGTQVWFDVYAGILMWDGVPRRIHIEAAETEPLAGMQLLKDYDLHVRVRDEGPVRITAIED